MHVDAMTLAAVSDEWRILLLGARIDSIIQPTEHAIALQCYAPGREGQGGQNRWVYLSAHPQLARAHVTALKPAKIASEPPPFVMLLRKHLEGARIESFEQPRWERVIEIVAGYRSNADSDERVRFRLIIEIMGRLSNIVLCNEEGLILGCLKHVGANVNRYRVIVPGVQYVPPPPQQRTFLGQVLPRLEPTTITSAQLATCSTDNEANLETATGKTHKRAPEQPRLWQMLTRHLLGFSPLLAREAVYRTTEDAETVMAQSTDNLWEELAWNVRELSVIYDRHDWHPQFVEKRNKGDAHSLPIAFSTYVLEQYAQTPDL